MPSLSGCYARTWVPPGDSNPDRVFRWRNWPYVVSGEVVTKSTVTVKQIAVTAGRDINMFRYWFYQPK